MTTNQIEQIPPAAIHNARWLSDGLDGAQVAAIIRMLRQNRDEASEDAAGLRASYQARIDALEYNLEWENGEDLTVLDEIARDEILRPA